MSRYVYFHSDELPFITPDFDNLFDLEKWAAEKFGNELLDGKSQWEDVDDDTAFALGVDKKQFPVERTFFFIDFYQGPIKIYE